MFIHVFAYALINVCCPIKKKMNSDIAEDRVQYLILTYFRSFHFTQRHSGVVRCTNEFLLKPFTVAVFLLLYSNNEILIKKNNLETSQMSKEGHPQYAPAYSLDRRAGLICMVFVSVFIWKYYLQSEREVWSIFKMKKIDKHGNCNRIKGMHIKVYVMRLSLS